MDLEDLEALEMHRRLSRRRDTVTFDFDDEDFQYRFIKKIAMKIVDLLRRELLAYDPRRHALTLELQVACALRNWARHEIQDDTGDLHGVFQSAVISKTCKKIAARVSHTSSKMPATLDELEEAMRKFPNIANFPNLIVQSTALTFA